MKPTPPNPCRDCEFRHAGCAAECQVWKDYEKERNDIYAENRKEQLIMGDWASHKINNWKRRKTGKD